jgi:transketolase
MILYSMLHLFGYDIPMSQMQSFRQWDSITPGHPEFGMTPGVEATTGPLGQGAANSVGLAVSGKMMAARYGADLFNYRVFALVSDGDLMEGVASEAASLAGHLGLGNLVYMYDDNKISLAGETDVCFTESVPERFEAYGWFVQSCDGHDMAQVAACLDKALAQADKPSIICCRTTLGFGSPNKKNTHEAHGSPLGEDEVKLTKKALGADENAHFHVPAEVSSFCAGLVEKKAQECAAWNVKLNGLKSSNAALAQQLDDQLNRHITPKLKEDLIATFTDSKKDATRNLSGQAINVIAKHLPFFVGGSADLEPSTKTTIKGGGDISKENYGGRNFRFGVREHAMGSAVNGLAYTQSWIPYSATFLVFSDYMRPVMRVAAVSHIQSLYVFTHDSFWVGEDGPTHEPIEHVMSMRLIPNLNVYRPADGLEVAMCYYSAIERKKGPSTLIFTRQNIPPLNRPASFTPDDILKGAYIVTDVSAPKLVIAATGSEVGAAVEAAQALTAEGTPTRVVSMPCVELYRAQPDSYKNSLFPAGVPRVSVEAGTTIGWASVLGGDALAIGIDHYGASAPGELLAEKFGFTAPAVKAKISAWLKQ